MPPPCQVACRRSTDQRGAVEGGVDLEPFDRPAPPARRRGRCGWWRWRRRCRGRRCSPTRRSASPDASTPVPTPKVPAMATRSPTGPPYQTDSGACTGSRSRPDAVSRPDPTCRYEIVDAEVVGARGDVRRPLQPHRQSAEAVTATSCRFTNALSDSGRRGLALEGRAEADGAGDRLVERPGGQRQRLDVEPVHDDGAAHVVGRARGDAGVDQRAQPRHEHPWPRPARRRTASARSAAPTSSATWPPSGTIAQGAAAARRRRACRRPRTAGRRPRPRRRSPTNGWPMRRPVPLDGRV